jgi:multiple sugar transport system ATP-binding protein
LSATSIGLQQVVKRYGDVEVIHGVDLKIEPGEFTVFVGPSGCGKSTLLRMIAGLEPISGGTLLIDEQRMNEVPASKRGIAMVFQSYALYPHMSVYQNLAFALETARLPRKQIEERVKRAAEILRIEPLLKRKPRQLSGGQRQRVAIGRAIVREPRIFLFDEPLSNLDAELRVQMRVEIAKLHRDLGNTMIYVTHDQIEALTLADRIAVMKSGVIQQFATPHEIYHHPTNHFVAGFIGSPTMNFLDGKLAGASGGWRFECSGQSIDLTRYGFSGVPAERPAILGVRPEHIDVGEAPAGHHAARGVVSIVEPMGADTVVWTEIGGKPSTIRLDGDSAVKVGDEIPFHFDPARVSLFDEATGARL